MYKKLVSYVLVAALALTSSICVFGADANTSDVKTIKKESKKELKKVLATLTNTKKSAYVDLTGDGVKDLFVKGTIYTYDYKNKIVKKVILSADEENPINKIKTLYVSKKKKRIYVTSGDDELHGSEGYSYYLKGCFFKMKDVRKATKSEENDYYVAREMYYVGLMKEPKKFIPKKQYKKGKKYYILNYSWNDQDDAWYDPYTTKQLKKKIKKMMPGKKKIKLKKKITI